MKKVEKSRSPRVQKSRISKEVKKSKSSEGVQQSRDWIPASAGMTNREVQKSRKGTGAQEHQNSKPQASQVSGQPSTVQKSRGWERAQGQKIEESRSQPSAVNGPEGVQESEEESRRWEILEDDRRYAQRVQAAFERHKHKAHQIVEAEARQGPREVPKVVFKEIFQVSSFVCKNWFSLFTQVERWGWARWVQEYRTNRTHQERQQSQGNLIPWRALSKGTTPCSAAAQSNILAFLAGFSVPRTQAPLALSRPAAPYLESIDWGPDGTLIVRWINPPMKSYGPNVLGATLAHYALRYGHAQGRRTLAVPHPAESLTLTHLPLTPSFLKSYGGLFPNDRYAFFEKALRAQQTKEPRHPAVLVPIRELPRGVFSIQCECVIAEGENTGAVASARSQFDHLILPYTKGD